MHGDSSVNSPLLVPQPSPLGRWSLSRSRGSNSSIRRVGGAIGRSVRGRRRYGGGAEAARGPEAAGAPHALLQLGDLEHFRGVDALQDELRDAVTLRDGEVGVGEIEEKDLDLPAVVRVYDAGAGGQGVPEFCSQRRALGIEVSYLLDGEAGAGGNAAIC